ncbi:MAG: hypothetical protein ACI9HB_003148, partial [Gammaproteobacteria bacterium]
TCLNNFTPALCGRFFWAFTQFWTFWKLRGITQRIATGV